MTSTLQRGTAAPDDLLYFTDPARAAIDCALLAYTAPLLATLPRATTTLSSCSPG